MIGQDAVQTAQAFLDGVGYDAVVLTKLDGDARGGAALSIAQLTGRPVMFASSGEKLEDFDLFHPDRMASRILDLGDMLTLIEQAERTFDQTRPPRWPEKLASGEGFTLEDFVEQLAMVRKLGPIGNLLGMLPGAAQNREALSQVSDKDLDRAAAIVNSMTREERRNPKIINGSRRVRIAGGSGVTVGEVNQLIVRFLEGQKMMRQMMGSMPGMGGMRRGGSKARARARRRAAAVPRARRGPAAGRARAARPAAASPRRFGQRRNGAVGRSGPAGLPAGFGGLGGGDCGCPAPAGFASRPRPGPAAGPARPAGSRSRGRGARRAAASPGPGTTGRRTTARPTAVITHWCGASGRMSRATLGRARPSLLAEPDPSGRHAWFPTRSRALPDPKSAGRRPQPWLSRSS